MSKFQFLKMLFSNRLWTIDFDGASRWKRRIVRFVKLVRIMFETFAKNRMGFQCVALSYFVALAIVPLTALLFTLTGGLGISDKLAAVLYNLLPNNPEIINVVMEKADNIINVAKSGGVGTIGAVFFLWTIFWLMFQVERVFNNVWGIQKVPRKFYTRFSFYLGVLILLPVLILIFGSGIVFYSNMSNLIGVDFGDLKFLPKLLGWGVFYAITVLTFSAMYKYIPATFVRYKNALRSAMFSAIVFTLFQYLYLETQVFVSRLNGVYGALAAIPLFLIWMNFCWQIIIYGAQLTYGYQHVDTYKIPEWELDN